MASITPTASIARSELPQEAQVSSCMKTVVRTLASLCSYLYPAKGPALQQTVKAKDLQPYKRLIEAKEARSSDVMDQQSQEKVNIDAVNAKGVTPLLEACGQGDFEAARLLIRGRANVNLPATENEVTPLHTVCFQNHQNILQLLLDQGETLFLDPRDSMGNTPLHHACWMGHLNIVRILIEHHAQLDIQNNEGQTPLDFAQAGGHARVVTLLSREMGIDGAMKVFSQIYGVVSSGDVLRRAAVHGMRRYIDEHEKKE